MTLQDDGSPGATPVGLRKRAVAAGVSRRRATAFAAVHPQSLQRKKEKTTRITKNRAARRPGTSPARPNRRAAPPRSRAATWGRPPPSVLMEAAPAASAPPWARRLPSFFEKPSRRVHETNPRASPAPRSRLLQKWRSLRRRQHLQMHRPRRTAGCPLIVMRPLISPMHCPRPSGDATPLRPGDRWPRGVLYHYACGTRK